MNLRKAAVLAMVIQLMAGALATARGQQKPYSVRGASGIFNCIWRFPHQQDGSVTFASTLRFYRDQDTNITMVEHLSLIHI